MKRMLGEGEYNEPKTSRGYDGAVQSAYGGDYTSAEAQAAAFQAAQEAARSLVSKWDVAAPAKSATERVSKWGDIVVPESAASKPAGTGVSSASIDGMLSAYPALVDGPYDMRGCLLNFDEAEVTLKLSVPNDLTWALLGNDGATLQQVRAESGCRIRILSPVGVAATARFMQLGGTTDAVGAAVGLLLAELHKTCATNPSVCTPEKLHGETVMSFTVRMFVNPASCGSIIGKGGTVIANIRAKSSAIVKVEEAAPDAKDRSVCVVGPVERVHVALLDVIAILTTFTKQMREKAGGGGGGAPTGPTASDGPPVHVHNVSTTLAGKLIGPGGSSIKEIREKSGAKVKVGDEVVAGCGERPVSIWGSAEQVQTVMTMIEEILARPDAERTPRRNPPASTPTPTPYGAPTLPGAPPPYDYSAYPPQPYGYPPPPGTYAAAPALPAYGGYSTQAPPSAPPTGWGMAPPTRPAPASYPPPQGYPATYPPQPSPYGMAPAADPALGYGAPPSSAYGGAPPPPSKPPPPPTRPAYPPQQYPPPATHGGAAMGGMAPQPMGGVPPGAGMGGGPPGPPGGPPGGGYAGDGMSYGAYGAPPQQQMPYGMQGQRPPSRPQGPYGAPQCGGAYAGHFVGGAQGGGYGQGPRRY